MKYTIVTSSVNPFRASCKHCKRATAYLVFEIYKNGNLAHIKKVNTVIVVYSASRLKLWINQMIERTAEEFNASPDLVVLSHSEILVSNGVGRRKRNLRDSFSYRKRSHLL